MKHFYIFLFFLVSFIGFSQNVTIAKIIEANCSSPFLRAVELYVDGTVDFSSEVVLNYMRNGSAWADNQIDISALGTITDSFVYIVTDLDLMQAEFPSTNFDASNTVVVNEATNGDDGYQIVLNGAVVSQFGRTETDADNDTESDWNHNDTVATRLSRVDTNTWNPSDWSIREENDLDSHTACQNSDTTLEAYFNILGGNFPLGSWNPETTDCTTTIDARLINCDSSTLGATDDTYTVRLDFSGGNTTNAFTVTSTAGTVSGDDPNTTATGTIIVGDIPEGTDTTITLSNTATGGPCNIETNISSPGCVPLVINEVLFDPAADNAGDANRDGTRDASDDEFIELINNSETALDISGYTISDLSGLRHRFPTPTVIPANGILVVFGGGTPTGSFGSAITQTASEGGLSLANGGDVVTIANAAGAIVAVFDSEAISVSVSDDQSVTRNPDITGDFVLHSTANPNLLFSPGQLSNDSTLAIELFENQNFNIFPNPASNGFVTISGEFSRDIKTTIFDTSGKVIFVSFDNKLDISSLKSGTHFLNISQGRTVTTKKLLIK